MVAQQLDPGVLLVAVGEIIMRVVCAVNSIIKRSRDFELIDALFQLPDATLTRQAEGRNHKDHSGNEFSGVPRFSFQPKAKKRIEENGNDRQQYGPNAMAVSKAVPNGIDCAAADDGSA
ncbi:MAG TPA: hypothetical protein VF493_22020 [Terriglobales bacterium]